MATWASAQTTAPEEVMFHWGRVHLGTGQALVLNLELTDHFGGPLTLPVELQLEDKDGNVIYRQLDRGLRRPRRIVRGRPRHSNSSQHDCGRCLRHHRA